MANKTHFWRPLAQKLSKRQFLSTVSAVAASVGLGGCAEAEDVWDAIIVGGGTAGLPAAIFAGQRGGKVLVIEAASAIGGTLFLSTGQMSAAGTKLQKSKGVTEDSPQSHYDDVMNISHNTADPYILRLATDNAAGAFDWLTDNGFEVYDHHPVTGTTHEPYSHARYAWHKEGGMGILALFEEQLEPLIESGAVTIKLNTEASSLIQNDKGDVIGVETVDADGVTAKYMGKNVVLTSGGYASNPEMFEDLEGAPDYSDVSYPYSQGAGITLGTSVGGYVRYGENHLPLFGAILGSEEYPAPMVAVARHFPGDRPPWEIIVDAQGERFLQEDILSHAAYEEALLEQPGEECWMVWDHEIHTQAPKLISGGFMGMMDPDDIADAFNEGYHNFFKADSIDELAEKMGVGKDGLTSTIAQYNIAQASGKDALGRSHMPLPIEKGPFYGIRLQSWFLTTFAGIAVGEDLQVIRQDGSKIGGLYAAGELLGTGATSGRAICGGMLVTPAITFGKLLGERILQFDV
ncbi:MAG: FAD-dependent oxidoreductase [Rhodospirillaceae bacterium]|jgi:fumarate reductase flavoprotein subunit|nr:FAD-dependent oxidoreductase [Rhodospirillaceae bacterium]MBT5567212.1 FAD-dependent oxidoreductase [Rhodospirillaceae bacterium]MBT6089425.1 FAD-dependent oxidoreductase [Rhodospirillaceae bacterium]MBT7450980.1 FAD-dependent oxidoreductase [Rhodospirillaceae bacterium]